MAIKRRMDKYILLQSYSGIGYSNNKGKLQLCSRGLLSKFHKHNNVQKNTKWMQMVYTV